MALDAGEVQARLTANDQMSAAIKAATERVAQLQAQIESLGNVTGPTLQMLQQNLQGAQMKLTELKEAAALAGRGLEDAGGAATSSGEQFSQMDRIATRLVERMLVFYALKETFQFVKGIFDAADAMEALSRTTDMSITKLQELKYGSDELDVPFAKTTSAIDALQKNLASLKPVVVDTLSSLGFSLDQIFNMTPDERFDKIGVAIGSMADKTARTKAEMALFGTDAIDPLLVKLRQMEEQAHTANAVLGDDTVHSLAGTEKAFIAVGKAAHDYFAEFLIGSQNVVATLAQPLMMGGGWDKLFSMALGASLGGTSGLSAMFSIAGQPSANSKMGDIPLPSPSKAASAPSPGASSSSDYGQGYLDSLWAQSLAVKALTEVQKSEVQQLIELDAWTADNAAKIGLTSLQYREVTKDLQNQAKAEREAEAAAKHRHTIEQEAILLTTKLWDEYDQTVVAMGTTFDQQVASIDRWAEDVAAKAQKAGTDINGFYEALTAVWTAKLNALAIDGKALTQAATTDSVRGLEQIRDKALNTYNEALKHVGEWSAGTIAKFKATYDAAQAAVDNWGSDNAAWLDSLVKKEGDLTNAINTTAAANRAAQVNLTAGTFAMPTSESLTRAGILQGISVSGIQSRDVGGPVSAGQPYLVGKGAQPELFIPSSSGTMVPNGGGGGGNVNVVINVSAMTPGDPRVMEALRQSVDQVVIQSLRNLVRLSRA